MVQQIEVKDSREGKLLLTPYIIYINIVQHIFFLYSFNDKRLLAYNGINSLHNIFILKGWKR